MSRSASFRPKLRTFIAAACLLSAAAAPASAAEVRESFDGTVSPAQVLGGSLHTGDDGKWVGAIEGGSYVLTNAFTAGAVRYSHVGVADGSAPSEVSIDVTGQFDGEASGAGLLYRYDGTTKGYFAFVLTADGYALYKRTPKGFQALSRGSNAAVKPDGANRLTVKLEGSTATLLVNGKRVLGHKSEGAPAGREVGLIALDLGTFRFDNFELVTN